LIESPGRILSRNNSLGCSIHADIVARALSLDAAGDRLIGLTAAGGATVAALTLNRPSLVIVVGWHPPVD
jgi:hypothetical protein